MGFRHYNKRTIIRDHDNFASLEQKESKLNSTIVVNSGVHALTDDKIKKSIQSE